MDKRISSRAIIISDGTLLTLFRRKIKNGNVREYYVIPGGGLEEGETLQENVIRELKEELVVDIKILGYLGIIEHDDTIQYYFHCEIVNGTPKLGGEELDRMTPENYYEVRNISLSELDDIDISGKDKIMMAKNCEYLNLDEDIK